MQNRQQPRLQFDESVRSNNSVEPLPDNSEATFLAAPKHNPEDFVAEGTVGIVYNDPENPGHVIKYIKFQRYPGNNLEVARTLHENNLHEIAKLKNEAATFNAFYGDGSAEIIRNGSAMRMKKIPGVSLATYEASNGHLPVNHDELLQQLTQDFNDAGIVQVDMHNHNILYDAAHPGGGRYWPIDIQNVQ